MIWSNAFIFVLHDLPTLLYSLANSDNALFPKHIKIFSLFIWVYPMSSTLKCPPYHLKTLHVYEAYLEKVQPSLI